MIIRSLIYDIHHQSIQNQRLDPVALRGSQGEQFTELISDPLSGLLHSTFSALIILVLPAWRDGPVIRITVSPD